MPAKARLEISSRMFVGKGGRGFFLFVKCSQFIYLHPSHPSNHLSIQPASPLTNHRRSSIVIIIIFLIVVVAEVGVVVVIVIVIPNLSRGFSATFTFVRTFFSLF